MDDILDFIEIDPTEKPDTVLIGLHGIGADGYDLEPLTRHLRLGMDSAAPSETGDPVPKGRSVRFVLPHAPKREITLHGGIPSRAWFDILDGGWPRQEKQVDLDGIAASRDQVETLIAREVEGGVPPERIMLLGFSQGGVIALDTALRRAEPLAAVLALSTYLPTLPELGETSTARGRGTPIFMAHGTEDPVVPIAAGRMARDGLTGLGCAVDWHEYRMVHSICVDEIEDMRRWLLKIP